MSLCPPKPQNLKQQLDRAGELMLREQEVHSWSHRKVPQLQREQAELAGAGEGEQVREQTETLRE